MIVGLWYNSIPASEANDNFLRSNATDNFVATKGCGNFVVNDNF